MAGQPALPGLEAGKGPAQPVKGPRGPVARVVIDTPVPHLAQPFDYLIPDGMAATAGVRVQVRLAGQLLPGFVTEVLETSDHAGTLRPVHKLISPLSVLTPQVLALAREVSAAYAGSLADVLRLAIPKRHATVERDAPFEAGAVPSPEVGDNWDRYAGGPAMLRALEIGKVVRAVWTALPGVADSVPRWASDLQAPVAATLRSGRRVLVIVPTARDMELVAAALGHLAPVTNYHAELAAAPRYRAFLRILAGGAPIVVGTRTAAFAPIPDLGLTVIWDSDDENLAERHAPYPVALGIAAQRRESALLIGSLGRPVAAQQLVEDGWASAVAAPRDLVRAHAPVVHAPAPEHVHGDGRRIPSAAFKIVRDALQSGPVLIHVPRAGYLSSIRCASCGARVRCVHCGGPLSISPRGGAVCRWCDVFQQVSCAECGGTRLAAYSVGSERTTEEFGRAFPGVPVTLSNARVGIANTVGSEPRLVIATPGSEPIASGGYAAALILDAAVATARPELGAAAQALSRWLSAAALVRPASDGGQVMILGEPDPGVAQACVAWDPAGWARKELLERASLCFPPAWRLARVTGTTNQLPALAKEVASRLEADMLGPNDDQLLIRVPRDRGRALTTLLRDIQAERSAHKLEPLRVEIDPSDL